MSGLLFQLSAQDVAGNVNEQPAFQVRLPMSAVVLLIRAEDGGGCARCSVDEGERRYLRLKARAHLAGGRMPVCEVSSVCALRRVPGARGHSRTVAYARKRARN